MEDSGLGLLLKNGYHSQREREETRLWAKVLKECLWGGMSKARPGVRRTVKALCMLSTSQDACQTACPPPADLGPR